MLKVLKGFKVVVSETLAMEKQIERQSQIRNSFRARNEFDKVIKTMGVTKFDDLRNLQYMVRKKNILKDIKPLLDKVYRKGKSNHKKSHSVDVL
jgi:hypothetical protein